MHTYIFIKVINIYSDDTSSQFKQIRLFSNLSEWENEFSVQMLWNVFATSHGKGAVDGIGGTIKRYVWRNTRATTIAPVDAQSYAAVAKERCPNVTVIYVSSEKVKLRSTPKLSIREKTLPVPNTLKLHCVKAHNSKTSGSFFKMQH